MDKKGSGMNEQIFKGNVQRVQRAFLIDHGMINRAVDLWNPFAQPNLQFNLLMFVRNIKPEQDINYFSMRGK